MVQIKSQVNGMGYGVGVGQRMGHCGPLICRDQWLVFTEKFIQRGL